MTRVRIVACALVSTVALAACGHAQSVAQRDARIPRVGATGTFGTGALHGEGVAQLCLPTRAALAASRRMAGTAATDDARIATTDAAVPLATGVRATVLARDGYDLRVRLASGPWADTTCWIAADTSFLFR